MAVRNQYSFKKRQKELAKKKKKQEKIQRKTERRDNAENVTDQDTTLNQQE
ncbi:MAG: hypothetical protein V6Z89_24930 [Desulfobacter sp.]